jgi:anti-sigma factor RsiW
MNKKVTDLLYRSFDGTLTPGEKEELNEALAKSRELREEKERITAMRSALSASAAKSFRPFFAERVMHAITSAAAQRNGVELFFDSLRFAFRRVAVVGATAILILLAYNLVKSGDISIAGAFGMPQETLEEVLESPFDSTLEELL